MRLGIEKRVLLIIGLCGAFTVAIVFFIILPFSQRIRDLNEQTYQLRVYLEKKHQRAMDYTVAIKTLQKIAPEAKAYAAYVLTGSEKLKLITALEDVATKNNVSQQINNSNIDSGDTLITLTIQATGEYQNVLKYIHDLETLTYFLTIRKVQISAGTNPVDKTQSVTAILEMSLYAD